MSGNQNNPGGAEAQKNRSGTREASNKKPTTQSCRDASGDPGCDYVERPRIKIGIFENPELIPEIEGGVVALKCKKVAGGRQRKCREDFRDVPGARLKPAVYT
jgi:hypothetical protein